MKTNSRLPSRLYTRSPSRLSVFNNDTRLSPIHEGTQRNTRKVLSPITNKPDNKSTRKNRTSTSIFKNNLKSSFNYVNQCNNEELIDILKYNNILPHDYKNTLICDKTEYELENKIGSGTYNYVFDISQRDYDSYDHPVVLRQMQPKYFFDKNIMDTEIDGLFIQTYLSKRKEEGGLNCSNICKVYEFGYFGKEIEKENKKVQTNHGVYAVIEKLVSFDSFMNNISKQNNFDTLFLGNVDRFIIHIKNILWEVLEGLKCMHDNLYAHLDLKLNNIGLTNIKKMTDNRGYDYYTLIDEDKLIGAKLFDFGFTQKFENRESSRRSDYEYGIYFSPEANYLNTVILKSDIYMFGFMLYYTFLKPNYFTFLNKNEKYIYFKNEIQIFIEDKKLMFPMVLHLSPELQKYSLSFIIRETQDESKNIWPNLDTKYQELDIRFNKKGKYKILENRYKNLQNKYKDGLLQRINDVRPFANELLKTEDNFTFFKTLIILREIEMKKYNNSIGIGGKKRRSHRGQLPRNKRTNTRKTHQKK